MIHGERGREREGERRERGEEGGGIKISNQRLSCDLCVWEMASDTGMEIGQ